MDKKRASHPEKVCCFIVEGESSNFVSVGSGVLQGPVLGPGGHGLTVTEDLKWNTHIQRISVKANQTIDFLRRNLNIGAVTTKHQAYFSLVRPLLEYASTVWDPYTQ